MTPEEAGAVAGEIERECRERGMPERAENEKRYLKSDLEFAGASVPAIQSITKAVLQRHEPVGREAMLALVEALWQKPLHDRRMAATIVLERKQALLLPEDIAVIERLLRESRTWALMDGIAASVVGPLVERAPELASTLDRWATDDDFWIRRSALLAHLLPLRNGGGDWERFTRYADAMLDEKEFFIRKAIGWVLRDTARKRPGMVYEWVAPRTHRTSGVTIREVVRWLSPEQREILMAAYKAKRPVD
jgi:3-methyladenine DNA glycosylase AlkD